MQMIKVPDALRASLKSNLHIVLHIGKNGFTRSEYLKSGEWNVGQEIWIDNDCIKVQWVGGAVTVTTQMSEG